MLYSSRPAPDPLADLRTTLRAISFLVHVRERERSPSGMRVARTLTIVSICTPSAFLPSELRTRSSSHSTLPRGNTHTIVLPPYAARSAQVSALAQARARRRGEGGRLAKRAELVAALESLPQARRAADRSDEQRTDLDVGDVERCPRERVPGVEGRHCARGRGESQRGRTRREGKEQRGRTVALVLGEDVKVLVAHDHRVYRLRAHRGAVSWRASREEEGAQRTK